MRHYSHHAKRFAGHQLGTEFADEFGPHKHLDKESQHDYHAAHAGGSITKKLVEASQKMTFDK